MKNVLEILKEKLGDQIQHVSEGTKREWHILVAKEAVTKNSAYSYPGFRHAVRSPVGVR